MIKIYLMGVVNEVYEIYVNFKSGKNTYLEITNDSDFEELKSCFERRSVFGNSKVYFNFMDVDYFTVSEDVLKCSFCEKEPSKENRAVVSDKGTVICENCTQRCVESFPHQKDDAQA